MGHARAGTRTFLRGRTNTKLCRSVWVFCAACHRVPRIQGNLLQFAAAEIMRTVRRTLAAIDKNSIRIGGPDYTNHKRFKNYPGFIERRYLVFLEMNRSFTRQRAFGSKPVAPEEPVTLEGMVEVPLRAAVPCLIHNLSDNSALIEVMEAGRIPATFRLLIETIGFDARCDVIHRDGARYLGVAFEGGSRQSARASLKPAVTAEEPVKVRAGLKSGLRVHLKRRLR